MAKDDKNDDSELPNKEIDEHQAQELLDDKPTDDGITDKTKDLTADDRDKIVERYLRESDQMNKAFGDDPYMEKPMVCVIKVETYSTMLMNILNKMVSEIHDAKKSELLEFLTIDAEKYYTKEKLKGQLEEVNKLKEKIIDRMES